MKFTIAFLVIFSIIYGLSDKKKTKVTEEDKLKIHIMNQSSFKSVEPILDISVKERNGIICGDLIYRTILGVTYETYCRADGKNYLRESTTVKSR